MKNVCIPKAMIVLLFLFFAAMTVLPSDTINVALSIHEGTNMAAALSPDGKTLVIDLLGVLWTVPATGGTARRITDDFADARQPAWSPDGKSIVFQSYRDGGWHIWSVRPDGTNLKQLTTGPFDDREPQYSHDGTRIAFSSDRDGNYDIWVMDLKAGRMVSRTNQPSNESMPAWSPDDKEIAYYTDRPNGHAIMAVNASGAERVVQTINGTANAPSWSPDGKQILYNLFADNQSRLALSGNALTSGEDVFPFRAQWISADEFIYTADGKIKRRSLENHSVRNIEFTASVSFTRQSYRQNHRDFDSTAPRPVTGIVSPAISPDGKRVAFVALSDLWIMPIGGEPQRITNNSFLELDPTWSPDGRSLAYSTDRAGTMDVWVHDLETGKEERVTQSPGAELFGTWSPEGTRIAYVNESGEIMVTNVESGASRKIHERLFDPGRPTWSKDGQTLAFTALQPYSNRYREGTSQIVAVSVNDMSERRIAPLPNKSIGSREYDGPVWSPDGTQMAAVIEDTLWVIPVDARGQPNGKPRKLTTEIADAPTWSGDSKQILYLSNNHLRLISAAGGAPREIPVNLTWKLKKPEGRTVIHASHLFDGLTANLRDNVDIVIEGNRIRSVDAHRADLHTGNVVDAGDATVMPGLIETHAHLNESHGEKLGRIFLSYGITTVRNPATNPYTAMENRESVDAGVRLGPRVFTTGYTFDGSRIYYAGSGTMHNEKQVDLELGRAHALGYDLVKTYVRLPDSLQKRVVDDAHAHGMWVTSHELYPAVAFGADGVEHIRGTSRRGYSPKVSAMNYSYGDVIDLLTHSKMTLTPTVEISGGFSLVAYHDPTLLDDPRFEKLFPSWVVRNTRMAVDAANRSGDIRAREQFYKPMLDTVFKVARGGGRVIAGTDSPIFPFAIAFHAELQDYVNAGLTPFEALQTATTNAADALGAAGDLGSIEAGKLADLVFVDGNPLADIRNARKVRRVMKNGELYSMDVLLN